MKPNQSNKDLEIGIIEEKDMLGYAEATLCFLQDELMLTPAECYTTLRLLVDRFPEDMIRVEVPRKKKKRVRN